jgi:hypothetical protein
MEHVSRDDVHMSGRSNTANCNVIDYILTKTSFDTAPHIRLSSVFRYLLVTIKFIQGFFLRSSDQA